MSPTGKIIVLAFPDTFVKMSDELMCRILPLVGLGTRTHIKAGHAALVLIENATGHAQYYDFGRYITPPGHGRVRSAKTDVELEIPFKAVIQDDTLTNLNAFLLWLAEHPEKTHGSGRLLASLCEAIDYDRAIAYIENLQQQGSIPYKAFGATGSNCSRLVTETLLAATSNKRIISGLKHNKRFTPSTVGNVEKAALDSKIYEVRAGCVQTYRGSALQENLRNYFDKKKPQIPYTVARNVSDVLPAEVQLLTGTGSSAYFHLEKADEDWGRITRYTEEGDRDFSGYAALPKGFTFEKPYHFVYDSHCAYCHIEQDSTRYRLDLIPEARFNLKQRSHSA